MNAQTILDADLIPVSDAAASLGISEKRMIGFMARQSLYDPIGGDTPDGLMVYAWSLEPLRKRLADMTAEVQP